MKQYKLYIGALLMLVITASSCSKFLDITPKDAQDQDTIFGNSTGARQSLMGIYELLRNDNLDWQAMPQALTADVMSDDVYTGGANSTDMLGWQQMQRFDARAVSQQGEKTWKKCYVGIQRANILLSNYDKIEFKSNEEDIKSFYEGEAIFLRAHYYFEVLRLFENIPLIKETLGIDDWEDVVQASPEESYAFVAKEILEAIPLMSNELPENELGRLTKYAAKAELLKIFMFYTGVYNKSTLPVEDGADFTIQDAIKMADEIITNSGAYLSPSYADLFNENGNYNPEVLFEIPFANTGTGDWSHHKLGNYQCTMAGPRGHNSDILAQGWGFGGPSRELEALFTADDVRKASTIMYAKDLVDEEYRVFTSNPDNDPADFSPSLEAHYTFTGMFTYKYTTHAYRRTDNGTPELNYDQNYHYIRLADIYLIGAELYLQAGNQGKADEYVNMIRNRAGLASKSGVTLDDIYLERRLELAMEGHRYFDVIRRGSGYADQELTVTNYELAPPTHDDPIYIRNNQNLTGDVGVPSDYEVPFNWTRKFLPIPQRELDLNAGFKQNDGY
ncbi:RagB/SusD family nutrient uptake outer membrane protein [Flammeovirga sp. EKP202]|uniref:RagB/SusD family nutrient uptake outer membrane protein n=1 Tax=Flammeovirga sp. EKP202 TaxID=2770592 RepID=UPI00166001D0|nr:RagB/SusD family nutrient uptake outer membrane protein [Flammeovirga sp. EKP202]MBD0404074.1 RagB/SusD family nutrient uptake outer membrane protein [Flammeovirga sp. EKP202]